MSSVGPRMVGNIDIYRSAKLPIDQHGEEAEAEAIEHGSTLAAKGDTEGEAVWRHKLSGGAMARRASDVDDHVGRRLRARRTELGISQEKLADALGISYQQISKCESGVNRVSASRLWDIAQALEVDVGYFFEGIKKRAGRARKPSAGRPVGAKTARRKGLGARR